MVGFVDQMPSSPLATAPVVTADEGVAGFAHGGSLGGRGRRLPGGPAGGKARLTRYPGVGHDSYTQTYANPEIYRWLLEQVREEKPAEKR